MMLNDQSEQSEVIAEKLRLRNCLDVMIVCSSQVKLSVYLPGRCHLGESDDQSHC